MNDIPENAGEMLWAMAGLVPKCEECGCTGNTSCGHEPISTDVGCTLNDQMVCPCCQGAPDKECDHHWYPYIGREGKYDRCQKCENFRLKNSAPDGLRATLGQRDKVIRLNRTTPIRSRFIELQKWEGIVIEVLADSFVGRLCSITTTDPDSEAEFSLDELHDEDRPLATPGAIFYWTIGYSENRGQRIRASLIRFRRLPVWQKDEIETAKLEAKEAGNILQW